MSSAIVGNEEKWAVGYKGVMFRASSSRNQVDSLEWIISSGGSVIHKHLGRKPSTKSSPQFFSLMYPKLAYAFLDVKDSKNFENELEIKLSATFKDKTQSSCTVSNVRFSGYYTALLSK